MLGFLLIIVVMLMIIATGFVVFTTPATSEGTSSILSVFTANRDITFYFVVVVILLAVFVIAAKSKGVSPEY